ncbi:hypothetical protein ABZ904_08725 [Streptomyces sp. NPDC046900]|uniref:phage tail protein n=1 Tax=Streptomyces sp. NPDC046900 TaxID=3155473 RepID=UPI00340EDA3E
MALRIGELVGIIRADDRGLRRGLNDAELRMRGFQRDTEGRLRRLNGRFASSGDLAAAGLRRGTDEGHRFSLSLGRLGGMTGILGKLAGVFGSMAFKLVAAVPAAASLAATLANIAPAAGVAATGIFAAVSATAALKIGMSGVSDAVKEAFSGKDPEKLAEALKKLSPNAREFVLALKGMKSQFDALKTGVQDTLFRGLAQTFQSTAKSVLPVLRTNLQNAAGALNNLATGALMAARHLASSGTLGQALGSATSGLNNLSGIPAIVVNSLGQIGAAAGPSFERLTAAADRAASGIGDKLSAAFESGAMQDAIETAIDLIGQIAGVAANVGRILGSVFSAAQSSGGNFISTLQTITGALADAFASPAVQSGLKALFGTIATLAKTAAPLLGQALAALAPVLATLGPPVQILIKALGDALQPIIKTLGPVLVAAAGAVGALVEALAPLLPVVGQLIADLLPPLMPIFTTLADLFTQLAPVIRQIADGLGKALGPVLEGLGKVLSEIVTQYAKQFVAILQAMLPVLPSLIGLAVQLGQSFGQILMALAPLLPQITLLATQMITALLPAIVPLLPPIIQLATLLLRLATAVITTVVIPALQLIVKFLQGMQHALQPGIDAIKWLTEGIVRLFTWLYDTLIGHSIIPDMINGIVGWFLGLPNRAVSALSSLGSRIAGVASSAMRTMGNAITRGIGNAVDFIRGLPGKARSALGDLGGILYGAGKSLVRGFINGVKDMFGSVRDTLGNLTDKLTSWKGPETVDKKILTPAGRMVIGGFMRGIDLQTPALRAQLHQLTREIPGMGLGLGPGRAVSGSGGVLRIEFAGPEEMARLIRGVVATKGGGDVQLALGNGRRR